MKRIRVAIAALLFFTGVVGTHSEPGLAAPPTKDECIETHSRGQDHRDRGQMADAKRLFLLCAQPACPALIQSDCAKFGEELGRSVPSVSFSARDPKGNDLPDVQVFVDGILMTSRLDDGKAHDVDPGKHAIRFVRNGKEASVNVVIAVGEKGRNISVTLGGDGTATPPGTTDPTRGSSSDSGATAHTPSRSALPLVVAAVGGVAMVTGGILVGVGLSGIPDQCSTSPRECTAPPGDPVFDDAKSSVNLANLGLGLGIAGAVIGIGGLIWYFASSPSEPSASSASSRLLPFTTRKTAGNGSAVVFTF